MLRGERQTNYSMECLALNIRCQGGERSETRMQITESDRSDHASALFDEYTPRLFHPDARKPLGKRY
jgi:hypothetical protein